MISAALSILTMILAPISFPAHPVSTGSEALS